MGFRRGISQERDEAENRVSRILLEALAKIHNGSIVVIKQDGHVIQVDVKERLETGKQEEYENPMGGTGDGDD